jgi:hypothetical protein
LQLSLDDNHYLYATGVKRLVSKCKNVLSALAISIAAGPMLASTVGAATQSASSHGVTATFSYQGSSFDARDLRLVIRRERHISYDQPVSADFCGRECWPGYGQSTIHVRNLGPGNRNDVVLNLYSGGAHCCTIEEVFTYDATTTNYAMAQHDFGDPSAPLFDLGRDGRYEFESADDSFAYRFTDFAASGLPIEIVAFSKGRFVNVTRQYPKLVAKDAQKWLRAFRSEASGGYSDSTGIIAAWAADEDSLGHLALVRSFLQQQVVAGHLNEAMGTIEPRGRGFVVALDRFLRQRGYLR